MVPQRFFTHGQRAQGDRHVYASRTRFIPATLLHHFECVTWPLAAAEAGDGKAPGKRSRCPREDARHVAMRARSQLGAALSIHSMASAHGTSQPGSVMIW